MSNIVPLKATHDISATLRRIADQIDGGEFQHLTTWVLCAGHTAMRKEGSETDMESIDYETWACGPRADSFTVRGLLLTCATRI